MSDLGVCAYEEERRQKVQNNIRVLQSLGLPGISTRAPEQPATKRRRIFTGQTDKSHSLGEKPATTHTYSTRFHGAVTVSYKELDDEPDEFKTKGSTRSRRLHSSLVQHDPNFRVPESYTQKQLVCWTFFFETTHSIFTAFFVVFFHVLFVDRNHLEHANNLMTGSQCFQRLMMPMEQHAISADRKHKIERQNAHNVTPSVVSSVECVFSFDMVRIWMKSCKQWKVVGNGYALCVVTSVTAAFVALESTGLQQESWLHTSKTILLLHTILSTNISSKKMNHQKPLRVKTLLKHHHHNKVWWTNNKHLFLNSLHQKKSK